MYSPTCSTCLRLMKNILFVILFPYMTSTNSMVTDETVLSNLVFQSVENLIRYHMALKAPVYEDVILKSYVVREQWQLYHEQVLLDFDA